LGVVKNPFGVIAVILAPALSFVKDPQRIRNDESVVLPWLAYHCVVSQAQVEL
jgi:hypothetical protein